MPYQASLLWTEEQDPIVMEQQDTIKVSEAKCGMLQAAPPPLRGKYIRGRSALDLWKGPGPRWIPGRVEASPTWLSSGHGVAQIKHCSVRLLLANFGNVYIWERGSCNVMQWNNHSVSQF